MLPQSRPGQRAAATMPLQARRAKGLDPAGQLPSGSGRTQPSSTKGALKARPATGSGDRWNRSAHQWRYRSP